MPRLRDRLPWRRAKDNPPASSSRDSSCAATPPNLAEQVPAGTLQAAQQGQRTEPEPEQTNPSAVEETNEDEQPSAEADTPAPGQSLWDRAYVKLQESNPSLVADYEKLLAKQLGAESCLLKQEQLNNIATRGLERVSAHTAKYTIFGHEYVVKGQVAQASKLLIHLKSFISDAVNVSPQASLAWAGVCVILPLFSNPSTAEEAQSLGFDYVTSRMRLYVGFEEFLWPAHAQIAPDTKQALEASVEDLYVKILSFQLTSVLRFYRSWLGQLGRDVVRFDDWKYMLEDVKKAEIIVNDDFKRLRDAAILRELEKMTSDAQVQSISLKSLLSVAEMQLHTTRELLKETQSTRIIAEANQPPLDLPAIYEARYDSAAVHSQARCLEGTRKSIQERITSWVDDGAADNLFWLNGPAGTGKSTVARTVAETFAAQHRLAASYFFSRSRQNRNDLSRFFTTLASQVAENIPEYKSHLREALRDISGEALVSKSPAMQFEVLFTKVLLNSSFRKLSIPSQLIIVDAVDEFGQQDRVRELLKPLSELRANDSFRLCVLLTSRNTIAIDDGFAELAGAPFQSLNLHQEYSDESRADIEAYLSVMFQQLGSRATTGGLGPWPDAADIATVIRLATSPSPLFIYASTLHKFLLQKGRGKTPKQQLKKWLLGASDGLSQLAQTYLPVLEDAFQLTPEERQSKKFGPDAVNGHRIIGAVVLAGTPISAVTLAGLLDLELDVVVQWLQSLRTVLDVGEDVDSPVKLLHKSFSDFLVDGEARASDEFWIDCDGFHEFMALQCFWRMKSNGLKRDICNLGAIGCFSAEIEDSRIADCIPSDLQYAVIFCLHHLVLSRRQQDNFAHVQEFFRTHLLHWLEALSLLRSMQTAVTGMADLTASISTQRSQIDILLHEAYRFILSHAHLIQTAPLQVYVSALLFCPSQSLIKQYYHDEKPDWAVPISDMESQWDPCLMTIEPRRDTRGSSTTAALSIDGSKFAVVLKDVIQVYETSKWTVVGEFSVPRRSDMNLAFSHDGRRLALSMRAYHDDTDHAIQVWDWATGVRLNSFMSVGNCAEFLRFCSNDEQLACFQQRTLELIDFTTSQCTRKVPLARLFTAQEFKSKSGKGIVASPGGAELARIISGQSIYSLQGGWGDDTDEEIAIIGAPAGDMVTIVFSSDGELMARIRNDMLQLFSVCNGRNLATVAMGYSGSWNTSDLKFFDGDRRLAHVARDGKLYIWNVEPLALTQTIRIYDGGPFGVFFLDHRKQMISYACQAGSIGVWDISHPSILQNADALQELVYLERNWPSLSRMVTVSSDDGFALWDTRSAIRIQTLQNQENAQGGKEFNTSEIKFMDLTANHQRLVFGDGGNKVRVWDLGVSPRLWVLDAPTDTVALRAVSPNGAFLIFEMDPIPYQEAGNIHILDVRDDLAGWPATEFSIPGYDGGNFIFSDDGETLITCAGRYVLMWKLSTGWEYTRRFNLGQIARSCALSPDSRWIAACDSCYRVRVWDTTDIYDDLLIESSDSPWLLGNVMADDALAVTFSQSGTFLCLRSAGQRFLDGFGVRFWDADIHDHYSPNPRVNWTYGLKCRHVWNGKLEIEHRLATAPAARPLEVEGDGNFHVQTAYGIQKCGRSVETLTYEGYGLSEDCVWILKGSARVLFVPAAYRGKRPRIVDSVAILRHNTHILILHLR